MRLFTTILFLLGALISNAQLTLNDSLKAHYMMNGNTLDSSGNAYHAMNFGATLTLDRHGNTNSAYQFNGSSSFLQLPHSFDYSDITVSYWAYVESVQGGFTRMAYTTDNPQNQNPLIILGYRNFPSFVLFGNSGSLNNEHPISLNDWHLVTFTRSAGNVEVYLNCELAFSFTSGTGISNDGVPYARIGIDRLGRSQHAFHGKIDDLRIWNRKLSAQEINTLCHEEEPCLVTVYDTIVHYDTIIRYDTIVHYDTIVYHDTVPFIDTIYLQIESPKPTLNDRLSFRIYPNPTVDELRIEGLNLDAVSDDIIYEVVDERGRLIVQGRILHDITIINFAGMRLAQGVYHLSFNVGNKKQNKTYKIVYH